VCRKHGRLDLYKVWYLAVEILRDCVPTELPEPDALVTDGHQVLIESTKKFIDDNWQRDKKLAEVKCLLRGDSITPAVKELDIEPMRRVKWGMHPLGQKLVDDL
jgi:hypothetical protein